MFERIKLPYAYDALEPHIDKETVKVHYDGHHKTYEEKFNALVKDLDVFKGMSALDILRHLDKAPADKRTGIKNNGGGFYNHNLYFESLAPGGVKPPSAFEKAAEAAFGTWDAMLEKLHDAATATLFGSGYAWLVARNGKLEIVVAPNQDLPDGTLLLPVDMWEHAYYLKCQNKKVEYVKNLFKVVNWEVVARRMQEGNK